MRTRPLAKLATALVAGILAVASLAHPARATVVAGTLDLYNSSFDLVSSVSPGSSTNDMCSASTGSTTITTTGLTTGTLELRYAFDMVVDLFGDESWYRVQMSLGLDGGYTGNGSSITLSGSATINIRDVANGMSCNPLGSNDCDVTAGSIILTGSASPATLPGLALATLNGGNTVGDNVATGTCGALLVFNNGFVDVVDLQIEI